MEASMLNNQNNINFSHLIDLTYLNIALLPGKPSIYMICKKDESENNQVIFAGVSSNIKTELTHHLEKSSFNEKLFFCYSPTSAKNVLRNSKSPLYHRVA